MQPELKKAGVLTGKHITNRHLGRPRHMWDSQNNSFKKSTSSPLLDNILGYSMSDYRTGGREFDPWHFHEF